MNRPGIAFLALTLTLACQTERSSLALPRADEPQFQGELPVCSRPSQQALARAQELERTADARWARVPFASQEAPLAVLAMAEAESCFALVGERSGKLRTQSKRQAYQAEVRRRFARARLGLGLANRGAQLQRAQREVEEMLALLGPGSDAGYHDALSRLARRYRAQLADQARKRDRP